MYGLSRKSDKGFDDTIIKVREALQTEGFGVLTEIDVQKTLREKLDVNFRRYIILGACNPPLAHRALNTELEVGLLLPCNVIVYENDDGTVTASAIDARSMMAVVENDELKALAEEVNEKLSRAMERL